MIPDYRSSPWYNDGLALPPFVRTIDPEWLFGRIRCAPNEFLKRFITLYYSRFGNRRIGTMSEDRYRLFVEDTFYTQWTGKYEKLYATIDTINDPFQTVGIETQVARRRSNRNRIYGDYKSYGAGNTVGAGNTTQAGSNDSKSANGGFKTDRLQSTGQHSTAQSGAKRTATSDQSVDLFADSPQSQSDGAIAFVPNASGEVKGNWNDGHLTTAETISNASQSTENDYHGEDHVQQADQKGDDVHGDVAASYGSHWQGGSTQSKEAYQQTGHNNTTQNSGSYLQGKSRELRKGFEGYTASRLLTEWRETFLPFDDMFLNEFEPCLFGVMNADF